MTWALLKYGWKKKQLGTQTVKPIHFFPWAFTKKLRGPQAAYWSKHPINSGGSEQQSIQRQWRAGNSFKPQGHTAPCVKHWKRFFEPHTKLWHIVAYSTPSSKTLGNNKHPMSSNYIHMICCWVEIIWNINPTIDIQWYMIIYDISTIKPCIKPNLTTVAMAPKNGALAPLAPMPQRKRTRSNSTRPRGNCAVAATQGRCQRLNNNNMKIGMLWDIVWDVMGYWTIFFDPS